MPPRKRVKTEEEVEVDYSTNPAIPDADGDVQVRIHEKRAPIDHTCRFCGETCQSLTQLISHARSKHKHKGSSANVLTGPEDDAADSAHEYDDQKDELNSEDGNGVEEEPEPNYMYKEEMNEDIPNDNEDISENNEEMDGDTSGDNEMGRDTSDDNQEMDRDTPDDNQEIDEDKSEKEEGNRDHDEFDYGAYLTPEGVVFFDD
ncbi:hypothetical protein HD806DRAFT_535376 [Xylariaceae sp. AK1471]|nr:hypothetical protein HD806DRAFT_535376 [Xylariaceae sp. AK1471]